VGKRVKLANLARCVVVEAARLEAVGGRMPWLSPTCLF